jgi:adenylate kinase family enzyme
MLIGFPASGKSFLRNEILKRWCQFKYYNNDDINSKEINDKLINKNPENYSYVIDDNTNTNMDKRINILKKYNSHTKIAIYFNYSLEICFHLNYMRMYWFGKELVSKIVYNTLQKYFDKNNLNENFDYFIEINKLFNEFNFDDKIKYYF